MMAFNYPNYYTYPQYAQTGVNPNYSQAQSNQDERIWVTGEASALAYLVAPNSFVRLWDTQENVYYEKRADQNGRPYMETFEYKRRNPQTPIPAAQNSTPVSDYDDKIKALEARVAALEGGEKHDAEQ